MYEARGCNFTRPEAHMLRRAGDLPPSRIRDERPFILYHRITKEKVYLNNALAKIMVERRSQFGRNHPYKSVDETPLLNRRFGHQPAKSEKLTEQPLTQPNTDITYLSCIAYLTCKVHVQDRPDSHLQDHSNPISQSCPWSIPVAEMQMINGLSEEKEMNRPR